jgi:hypothetical protein
MNIIYRISMSHTIRIKAYLESNDNGYSWVIRKVESLGGTAKKSIQDLEGMKLIQFPEY